MGEDSGATRNVGSVVHIVDLRASEAAAGECGQRASQTAALSLRERSGNGEHIVVDRHGGTHERIIALTHQRIKPIGAPISSDYG